MAWFRAGGPSRSTLTPGDYKPPAETAGVPASASLTVVEGNFTFSANGQVAEGLEIRGYVDFNGKSNCTLRNCKVIEQTPRDTDGEPPAFAIRQFGVNAVGTIVEDCTIYPATPGENHHYAYWGYLRDGFFRRNDVSGFIDGCNVSGAPGQILANWFHDSTTWSPHPGWSDNKSHNDAIQMSNATGWTIRGNTFDWATGGTANILITRGAGPTSGNVIDKNWFDGGFIGINLADPNLGGQTITDNLAADRAAFTGSGIHIFSVASVTSASTITGNETYTGQAWFVYNT
jgi:hypothetical protein